MNEEKGADKKVIIEFEDARFEELSKNIKDLYLQIRGLNSFGRRFSLGIITGLGTVIGASLVLALAISILSSLSEYGILPSFNNWIVNTLTK